MLARRPGSSRPMSISRRITSSSLTSSSAGKVAFWKMSQRMSMAVTAPVLGTLIQ